MAGLGQWLDRFPLFMVRFEAVILLGSGEICEPVSQPGMLGRARVVRPVRIFVRLPRNLSEADEINSFRKTHPSAAEISRRRFCASRAKIGERFDKKGTEWRQESAQRQEQRQVRR